MSKKREHRRTLKSISAERVLNMGDGLDGAFTNMAADPCIDSWKTLLFKLQDAWSEVRNCCPEIPVEMDFTKTARGD